MALSVITITGQRQSGKTTTAVNLANRLTQRHGVAYMGWDEVPREKFIPSVNAASYAPVTKLSHNAIVEINDAIVKLSANDSRVVDVLVLDNADQYFHRANGLDDPKQHIIDTMSPLIGIKLLIMVMSTANPTTNDPYIQASDLHIISTECAGQYGCYIESCTNTPIFYSDYDEVLQAKLIDAISEERVSAGIFDDEFLKKIGCLDDDSNIGLRGILARVRKTGLTNNGNS